MWLNTPRRPWEACGTSGMKVLVNGGMNLSTLDGWWAEAYTAEVGWPLGDGREHGPERDAVEADELYRLLEKEVVPLFYSRDAAGIPQGWVARMRASMAQLTARFSSNRMLRDYVEKLYLPAAQAFRERTAEGEGLARQLRQWEVLVRRQWHFMHWGKKEFRAEGNDLVVMVQLYLGELPPELVQVQLMRNRWEMGRRCECPWNAAPPLPGHSTAFCTAAGWPGIALPAITRRGSFPIIPKPGSRRS